MSEIEPHRMDVQTLRVGRDRLVLLGDPQGPELVDGEHHHSCDYMGCGTSHVVGRAVLLRADGDRESWNRAREMLRILDAELHPWGEPGEVPTEPGKYWVLQHSLATEPKCAELCRGQNVVGQLDGLYWAWVDGDLRQRWACGQVQRISLYRFRRRWTPEPPR